MCSKGAKPTYRSCRNGGLGRNCGLGRLRPTPWLDAAARRMTPVPAPGGVGTGANPSQPRCQHSATGDVRSTAGRGGAGSRIFLSSLSPLELLSLSRTLYTLILLSWGAPGGRRDDPQSISHGHWRSGASIRTVPASFARPRSPRCRAVASASGRWACRHSRTGCLPSRARPPQRRSQTHNRHGLTRRIRCPRERRCRSGSPSRSTVFLATHLQDTYMHVQQNVCVRCGGNLRETV